MFVPTICRHNTACLNIHQIIARCQPLLTAAYSPEKLPFHSQSFDFVSNFTHARKGYTTRCEHKFIISRICVNVLNISRVDFEDHKLHVLRHSDSLPYRPHIEMRLLRGNVQIWGLIFTWYGSGVMTPSESGPRGDQSRRAVSFPSEI